jgi:hypothetical protein
MRQYSTKKKKKRGCTERTRASEHLSFVIRAIFNFFFSGFCFGLLLGHAHVDEVAISNIFEAMACIANIFENFPASPNTMRSMSDAET